MKKCYVLMLVVSFCISTFAQTSASPQGHLSTQSIKVDAGWNLMSLPLRVIDGTKRSLFPTAISDAFIYENSYQPKDTLENGSGFWLKFDSSETIYITGDMIWEDTIEVRTGWNIIGSLTAPVAVDTITSDPLGIITSGYFGYVTGVGYQETDTIQPGKGYWVKANGPGSIFLFFNPHLPAMPSIPNPANGVVGQPTNITLSWFACTDPDGDPVTYDVYFGTDNPPTTKVSSNQTDTSLARNGLVNGTQYFWKVVAKDDHNNSTVGPVWRFTTGGSSCVGTPTVSYLGKTYKTVQIGTQCWLKENLDVGTRIDGTQEQTDNSTIEKYCYGNNTANCDTYGGLYQWNEAMQYSTTPGARGICPSGWHIPTYEEFQTLSTTVGGDGNALKEIGQGTGAGAGTNTSGFSALISGYRYPDFFSGLGFYAYFWSSIEVPTYARNVCLYSNESGIYYYINPKEHGFSVRCVKD